MGTQIGISRSLGGLTCSLALLALLPVPTAGHAQSQSAPGDECAASAAPADEIACLRRALKEKTDALAARSGRPPERKPEPAPPVRAQADPMPPAAPVAQPVRRESPVVARAEQDLGREQLPGTPREAETGLQALVVSAQEDREGLFRIALGNGQVWKQVERPSVQIIVKGGRQYPVEITKSGFGGYRMYFNDLRRTIVVKRLQ